MWKSYSFIFIVGTIVVSVLLILFIPYIKNENSNTQALSEGAQKLLDSSDEKNKRAREMLSKKNTTAQEQTQARSLIQSSIDEAKKATELAPEHPKTWAFLGLIYKQLIDINPKNAGLAESALKKALALSPDSPNLYNELASVYISENKYKEAEKLLLGAIALNRLSANYHYKLGNVYAELSEFDKARSAYGRAKSLTPASTSASLLMIDAQIRKLEERAKKASSGGNRER